MWYTLFIVKETRVLLEENKMRSIRMGFPSGKVKMVMFEGTEDEEAFEVKSLQRGTPYIVAYGIKYYLSKEEIQMVKKLLQLKL